jgi:hypothetical protein
MPPKSTESTGPPASASRPTQSTERSLLGPYSTESPSSNTEQAVQRTIIQHLHAAGCRQISQNELDELTTIARGILESHVLHWKDAGQVTIRREQFENLLSQVVSKVVADRPAKQPAQRQNQGKSYSAAMMYHDTDSSEVGAGTGDRYDSRFAQSISPSRLDDFRRPSRGGAESRSDDFHRPSREVTWNSTRDYAQQRSTLQEGHSGQWRWGSPQSYVNSYREMVGSSARYPSAPRPSIPFEPPSAARPPPAGQHDINDGYYPPIHQQRDEEPSRVGTILRCPCRLFPPRNDGYGEKSKCPQSLYTIADAEENLDPKRFARELFSHLIPETRCKHPEALMIVYEAFDEVLRKDLTQPGPRTVIADLFREIHLKKDMWFRENGKSSPASDSRNNLLNRPNQWSDSVLGPKPLLGRGEPRQIPVQISRPDREYSSGGHSTY